MSSNLKTERYPIELYAREKTTGRKKVIRTTLGDLIAAVTDEVRPLVRDPSGLSIVVSHILNDLLGRYPLRAQTRSPRKYPSYFAQESMV